MKLSQNVVLSVEIFSAHKLRTLLSVLGIVVGVGAVVLMVSAGRGAEQKIVGRIQAMGSNLIVVNAGQSRLIAGRQRQMTAVRTLLPSDAEAIGKECPSAVQAAGAVSKKLNVRWESEDANTTVLGMTPEGFEVRNIEIADGRAFDSQDSRAALRLAVIGPTAAANLFGRSHAVGQPIRIGKVLFEVAGVTAAKGTDINGADQDDVIIVPLQTAMRRLLNTTYIQTIYVQARGAGFLAGAEKEIASLLRQRHRLQSKPDDFTIQNQATLLETERETGRSMTLLIGGVAGISLLVGGVGILAVMMMTVRERVAEIGLRRALGARRRDIRNQFLLESVFLSGGGGLLGVMAGVLAIRCASVLGWETGVSWPAAVVAFAFSWAIGVIFGLYPAMRAARLEPIQALRAE